MAKDVDYVKRAQNIYRDEHKGVRVFTQEDAWPIEIPPKWDVTRTVDLTGDVLPGLPKNLFGHDALPHRPSNHGPPKNQIRRHGSTVEVVATPIRGLMTGAPSETGSRRKGFRTQAKKTAH
ncbi:hypothetical protein Tco_1023245 [Tanacetum coccineum]